MKFYIDNTPSMCEADQMHVVSGVTYRIAQLQSPLFAAVIDAGQVQGGRTGADTCHKRRLKCFSFRIYTNVCFIRLVFSIQITRLNVSSVLFDLCYVDAPWNPHQKLLLGKTFMYMEKYLHRLCSSSLTINNTIVQTLVTDIWGV